MSDIYRALQPNKNQQIKKTNKMSAEVHPRIILQGRNT
jgi:hypothetical protein